MTNSTDLQARYTNALQAFTLAEQALSEKRTQNIEQGLSADFGNQGFIQAIEDAQAELNALTSALLSL